MLDITTKSGNRIARISDSADQDDTIVLNGKDINLSDAYSDEKIKESFNQNIKKLKGNHLESEESSN